MGKFLFIRFLIDYMKKFVVTVLAAAVSA